VNDEQLTISGVPSDGGQSRTRGARPLRPRLVPPQDSKGVTPSRGPDGHSARPRAVAAHDVDDLGVRTDLVTACRIALGVGSTTAYALAGRGELPFPAYRVGRQWVVPTAGLRAFLGLP
jgi:hypothetical protein